MALGERPDMRDPRHRTMVAEAVRNLANPQEYAAMLTRWRSEGWSQDRITGFILAAESQTSRDNPELRVLVGMPTRHYGQPGMPGTERISSAWSSRNARPR